MTEMTKPMVNISCPSGNADDGEIAVGGERLLSVGRIELTLEPNSLVYARLDVWASLNNVQAVFDAFPVWEPIQKAPKDGTKIIICLDEDDAQASWWISSDERWANWNHDLPPEYWAPMPRMM